MNRLFTSTALTTILLAASVPFAAAQELSGKVTDASGEAPLQGAIVEIEGLNRSGSTDRYGEYSISNVPAGEYDIVVSYVGTAPLAASVTVAPDGTVANFTLGADVRYLDNILVVGSAAAQAGAINQQRASDAIISVIDSDGLGNFPDTTVADSLARMPGLSIENDQGEGRYVSIRGINTDLIAASINGVRTPSPEDRRGVLLDGVPSDLLDGITVQKSLTPDVDADSLGGVIDLKTISAFDRDGAFIRAKLEGAYNEITEEMSPKATLTYSNVFNDKFGVALSLNYQDLRIESHNNEVGEWGMDDDTGLYTFNDDYEQRWYNLTRERLGIVANFDYRLDENTDLYLRTLFNQYTDDEVRNKFEYRSIDDFEDVDVVTSTSSTFPLEEIDAEVRLREEVRQIQTYALGGKTDLDAWSFDYEIAYAFAEEDDSNNHDVTFRSDNLQDLVAENVTFDWSNPETPRLIASDAFLAEVYNPANYNLDAFEREFTTNEDTETSAKFNVSKDGFVAGTPVTWKAGLKLRDREKTRDANLTYEEADINLAAYVGGDLVSGWRLANPQPLWPDPNLTAALRNSFAPGDLVVDDTLIDSTIEDFSIEEQILAGYAMGTFDLGNTTIVAGVRIEKTDVDMTGQFFDESDTSQFGFGSFATRTVSDDYTNVLPSINIKHSFNDKLIGRAAYYAALVRPGFGEMAPFAILNDDRDGVEMGNPDLDPLEADNFDLSIEYYPTELSLLSFGVFYKDIENAIYGIDVDLADLPSSVDLSFLPASLLDGDPSNDEIQDVETYINVPNSEIIGAEFNYVQGLDFLGGVWEGFLVSGNLTLTDSESTLPDGRKVRFLKQSDTVWNVALGYDKGPWDLRVSANFRGNYLDELTEENLDRTTDDRMLVEASAKYDVNDNLQLYLEGKNLTDEPEYYYFGDENRLSQYDEFGSTWIIGARVTF
ncbi:MAG: TonB-dependent receptor [Alphaproteobacteria bacterium]|nr:TonB-dependent receptor [Alphaproteobacteria bacterium]